MTKKVIVCDPMDEGALSLLRQQSDLDIDYQPEISLDELNNIIGNYQAAFVRSRTKLRQETLEKANNLKVIGRAGTGLDNIDVAFAESKGIKVLNTPGANANAVAELTLCLMLMLARRVMAGIETINAGQPAKVKGFELQGKTLGLVGFGNIGRLTANLARGFKMNVLAFDPLIEPAQVPEPLRVVPLCPLDEVLAQSDFVSLHTPLLDNTEKMANTEFLGKFKRGAYLINTARAGLIDDLSVLQALEDDSLAGFGTDLYEADSPLFKHPNVIATPHIGASTIESQRRAGEGIVKRVVEALAKL